MRGFVQLAPGSWPTTRFVLIVDGVEQQSILSLHVKNGVVTGRANKTNLRFGLPAGVHRFAGLWYSQGELVLTSDKTGTFTG